MNTIGIVNSVYVFLSYFLLVVILPSIILKSKVKNENIFKRLIIYIVFGNFYISTIVFALAYLNIFTRFSLILSLIFVSSFTWFFINRKDLKTKEENFKKTFKSLILKEYGLKLFIYRLGAKIRKKIKDFFQQLFHGKKIEWLIFLAIIAYNLYQYGINGIEYVSYMAPDEEVHLYWIQSMLGGNIYPSGVYPHVFHNILGAITKLFNFNGLMVLRYFSFTSIFLIFSSLYLGLRRIFSTKYPALFGMLIYTIMNLYGERATLRFQFVIPQEYGMIMLMPMAIFLLDYLRDKKIEDLIFFSIALSLTISTHFYTGIIGILLTISIGIVHLYRIIKDRVLGKLIIAGILAAVIALGPLGVGLALGHDMEQSMDWASDVIKGDIYSENRVEEGKEKVEVEPLTWNKFTKAAKRNIENSVVHNIETVYIFLGIIFISIIFNLSSIYFKKSYDKSRSQMSFGVFSLIILFLILFRSLGLPTIMETNRLAIYFAYFSPFSIGMPLELIYRTFKRTRFKRVFTYISLTTMVLSLGLILKYNLVRPLPPFYYFQTSGTMISNMMIMEEYPDNTWTAISPVNNISGILNHGYHYELSTFIILQENWNEKKEIKIPTENIFLYIEKMPIERYGWGFYRDDPILVDRKRVNKEDALEDLSQGKEGNYHYEKERDILMSKAYYWAKEYMKYFPKEMSVYYEDRELIVYKIKQNKYALNNLSIDYKMNTR